MGFSVLGTVLIASGIGVILSNVSQSFFQVQAALAWDSGCTACGNIPIYEAAGMNSVGTADSFGGSLAVVGVTVISLVMLRGTTFNRVSGYRGLLAGIVSIVGAIAFSSLSGGLGEVANVLPSIIVGVWVISLAPRLWKL